MTELPRQLGNGLVLRRATVADAEALGQFNLRIHEEPGADVWTRDLVERPHPTFRTEDFTIVERSEDGRLFNTYLVGMPDGSHARHRKLHCFISGHMDSGDEFTVFDTPHDVRLGVLICYDNNLVENVRINALMGAEVLMAPHQTGGCNSGSPFAMGVIDRSLWDRREERPDEIEAELNAISTASSNTKNATAWRMPTN